MTITTIGPDRFTTTRIGLGCMGLSQGYGPTDDRESARVIHAALDAGITGFDTAMSYGGGHNETLVGAALRGSGAARDDYQVASKFGIVRGPDGVHLDGRPEQVRQWCEASLRRLGTDHLDLYYLHRVDPDVPIEESVGAMADLVRDGTVRHLGLSEVTPGQLRRAHAVHPISAVQFEWSLMWRAPELDIVPAARDLGVGLVAYSPLGRGLLGGGVDAGNVRDSPFRSGDERFDGEPLQRNLERVAQLRRLAGSWGLSPAQLALAWLLDQGDDVVALPGSSRVAGVAQNAAAMRVRLDDGQRAQLADLAADTAWCGDRTSFAVPVTRRPGAGAIPRDARTRQ